MSYTELAHKADNIPVAIGTGVALTALDVAVHGSWPLRASYAILGAALVGATSGHSPVGYALLGAAVLSTGIGYARSLVGGGAGGIRPAVAMTLWTGNSLSDAWRVQRQDFIDVQPNVMILHISPSGGEGALAVVQEARAAIPGLRIWVQLSCGSRDAAGIVETARRVVEETGAEAVSWNAEHSFKDPGGDEVARAICAGWAAISNIPQMQSAYGNPMQHHSYPWSAWFPPCIISLCQDYPIGEDVRSGTQPDGLLTDRVARDTVGWNEAVAAGMIPATVYRGTYIPGAHMTTDDVLRACSGIDYVAVWPWHGRYDEPVKAALKQLARSRS